MTCPLPTCDVCGKPVDVAKDGRYTLADVWDDETDRLVTTRHIECTAENRMRASKKEFDGLTRRVDSLLSELRSKLR